MNEITRDDITPELLRDLLEYEPETGTLFWKPRPLSMFEKDWHVKQWNTRFAGNEAGSIYKHKTSKTPYRSVRVSGIGVFAHRVAWAIHFGKWPAGEIDHINGNGLDNRIENLRDVPHADNAKNRRRPSDNKSDVIGVHKHTATGKWRAAIRANGKLKHLGSYRNKSGAIAARKAAEREYGFHPNHGRAKAMEKSNG